MPSRILPRLLVGGFLVLLANSAYLWAFAEPTLPYFIQVGLHPVLGLALAAGALWLIIKRGISATRLLVTGLGLSAAGLALGVAVLLLGATTPYRRLVLGHVASSALGAAVLLVYVWQTLPRFVTGRRVRLVQAAIAVVVVASAGSALVRAGREGRWRA